MADWDWGRVVFDHVKLTVSDPEASKACYRTVLGALDIPPLWEDERGGQYANLVVVKADESNTPIHIGFVARTPRLAEVVPVAALETARAEEHEHGYSSPR